MVELDDRADEPQADGVQAGPRADGPWEDGLRADGVWADGPQEELSLGTEYGLTGQCSFRQRRTNWTTHQLIEVSLMDRPNQSTVFLV